MPARSRLRRVPHVALTLGRGKRPTGRLSVVVRPYADFDPKTFRRHDIGRPAHTFRLAGKLKKTGKWATHSFQFPANEILIRDRKVYGRTANVNRTLLALERRYGKVMV